MKTSRFRYSYRENASKLHRAVGDLLRSSSLQHQGIYQEYPVKRVNPSYQYGSHHFDWVLLNLKVVIECHGKQHYEPVAFGGDVEDSIGKFRDQKRRDSTKKEAALEAGFAYVEIPYTLQNKLSEGLLLGMIDQALEEIRDYISLPPSGPTEFELEQKRRHKDQLEKARKYRKERYRQQRDAKHK